jgi:hypothetical protein
LSIDSAATNSSRFSSIKEAILESILLLSSIVVLDQEGNASAAA